MRILLQLKELGSSQNISLCITALLLSSEKAFNLMLHWYRPLSPFGQLREVFPSIALINPFNVTSQTCVEDTGIACCFPLILLKSDLLPEQMTNFTILSLHELFAMTLPSLYVGDKNHYSGVIRK